MPLSQCVMCGYESLGVTLAGRCPQCHFAEHRPTTQSEGIVKWDGAWKRMAFDGDEVHSEDRRTFISDQREGWEVVIEGKSDSFHETRDKARASIRAWKVRREAARLGLTGESAIELPTQNYLAICKLLKLSDSSEFRAAVRARGLRVIPETTRFDLLSEGGLDID